MFSLPTPGVPTGSLPEAAENKAKEEGGKGFSAAPHEQGEGEAVGLEYTRAPAIYRLHFGFAPSAEQMYGRYSRSLLRRWSCNDANPDP